MTILPPYSAEARRTLPLALRAPRRPRSPAAVVWLIALVLFAACVAGVLVGGMAGCAPSRGPVVAAQVAGPALVEAYRVDLLVAVEGAASREDALQRLAAARARWAPTWAAWHVLEAVARDGGDVAAAWCRVVATRAELGVCR